MCPAKIGLFPTVQEPAKEAYFWASHMYYSYLGILAALISCDAVLMFVSGLAICMAIAKKHANSLELRVHPTLIPLNHLLSSVKGEDNAVFIRGDMIGESMLYGKGAGSLPAASSVISDIIDIGKNIECRADMNYVSANGVKNSMAKGVTKIGDLFSRYYVRISAIDKPGVLAGISTVFAKNKISIATVSQKQRREGQVVPIVMLTHEAKESAILKALKAIDGLGYIKRKSVMIRLESKL